MLRHAFGPRPRDICSRCGLSGTSPADIVAPGPPQPGLATWGAGFAAALQRSGGQGAFWEALALLSDARALPPSERRAFYAQFDDAELLALLVEAVGTSKSNLPVRHCARNLGRGPNLRPSLLAVVPALVRDLSSTEEGVAAASAAALCNVACHAEAKEKAVECGAVRQLLGPLRSPGLAEDPEAAEDLVACLGVLTAGCKSGLGELFTAAAADGRLETFEPLFRRLEGESPPSLQCLVLEVLGDICASSPQFREWLVKDSPVVSQSLPRCLRSDTTPLRKAALQLSAMLAEDRECKRNLRVHPAADPSFHSIRSGRSCLRSA